MIRSRVQTAATPITPAPKKRTSDRKTVLATSSAGPGTPAVMIGEHDPPAGDQPGEHRHADRDADQMAGADQREGEAARNAGRGGADMEILRRLLGEQPCLGDEGEGGGGERGEDDQPQALLHSPRHPRGCRRRISAPRPRRRLRDREGGCRRPKRAGAAPRTSPPICRRPRSPPPSSNRESRSTSRS